MSYFPTEEEEFELQYQDDLDELEGICDENGEVIAPSGNRTQLNRTAQSINLFDASPAFSQISIPLTQNEAGVQRRLFGTPVPNNNNKKYTSSTPFSNVGDHSALAGPSSAAQPSSQKPNPIDSLQQLGLNNPHRKRRLEDLFGDIADIPEEDEPQFIYETVAKRVKSEDEIDQEMIEKILQLRNQLRAQINPLKQNNLDRLEALHRFKMQNLSYALPRYPFITLIRENRDRVYVRMHSEEFEDMQIKEISFARNFGSLLGEERENVWTDAQKIVVDRIAAASNATEAIAPVAERQEFFNIPAAKTENLWVEKYRPRKYLDLLSDETTNRSLLSWLKMWDKVVFNREFKLDPQKDDQAPNTFNKKTGKFEAFGRFKKKFARQNDLKADLDEHGRPMQKIALLCGPPGLGKTTLAHTIARHAGYNVREINASDDRSPEAFKLALENGTQMKSMLNKDNRPNCIILDEIDGAPTTSIDFLLRFINGGVVAAAKPGAKPKNSLLKRPIICICNDMYATSLRQLRQIAFVVIFPPMESARLADRLTTISKKEKLKTDLSSLLALAEKTGNDVRSCLSMLQFFASVNKPLTLIDVLKSNIGEKDRQKGLFAVWGSIFQIQRPQKKLCDDDSGLNRVQIVAMTDTTAKTRMANVLDVVHRGGDYERLTNGVYENYLLQRMPDPNMVGVAEANEWFCFSDRLQRFINSTQNYSVYSYLQYGFVAWHFLFATMTWPKINFPNQSYEYFQKTNVNKMIESALRKGFSVSCRGIGEGPSVLLDTVPLLRKVLAPSLRSVSMQLLTPKERADVRHVVEVMTDLGLAYTQTKAVDGTYQFKMEPDIDTLCHFKDVTDNQQLNYWGRQMVAREVELERMRRAVPKVTSKVNAKSKEKASAAAPLPNHLQQLLPRNVSNAKLKETVSKDFFGRISSKQMAITVSEGGTDDIVKSPIWYKFKEGYNNAVRKDITIKSLL